MGEIINLFADGEVVKGERKFTRLMGGFSEDDYSITTKQIAELMNYENSIVNRTINRNIKSFTENLDIIDLKLAMPEWNSEIGYTKNAYNASKNVYILSKSGFLLYLKFAEGDQAVELYKDFIEDYFKTKAENEVMKDVIEQTIESLNEEKAMLLGKVFMAKDEGERFELMQLLERKNEQILELTKTQSEEEVCKQMQSKVYTAEKLEDTEGSYDIGTISKVFAIKNLGRNNLFKWLKENKILTNKNEPYQQFNDYFKVIVTTSNGYTSTKTLLKPKGIDFLVKRLINNNKIIPKSIEQIKEELKKTS